MVSEDLAQIASVFPTLDATGLPGGASRLLLHTMRLLALFARRSPATA